MERKRWILADTAESSYFDNFQDLDPILVQILYNRGIRTSDEARDFLQPNYEVHSHDPFLMDDMEHAVRRIIQAVKLREKITVYGDYDVDGVCASTILYEFLACIGCDVDVYMNHREQDGYGLQKNAIERLAGEGTKLIITNDCGISNRLEVERARELNIDVIITDHHHVPDDPADIPPAFAIIHPRVRADRYPFKYLAGGGTAFKLVQGLIRAEFDPEFTELKKACLDANGDAVNWEGFEKWLLDVVCISTIGDCMPLVGENRAYVHYGLKVLNKTRRIGLQSLIQYCTARQPDTNITTETVGYYIGPRINAASRMDHGKVAFELMIARTEKDAQELAKQLDEKNSDRQKLSDKIFRQALAMVQADFDCGKNVLVAYQENWPLGVLGLVAGKICNQLYRPVFLVTNAHGTRAGTARSIQGYHVAEVLKEHTKYLARFGGHAAAGGFAVAEEASFEDFKSALESHAAAVLTKDLLTPSLFLECELALTKVELPFVDLLKTLEPYGEQNRKPRFLIKGVSVRDVRAVGKTGKHLRLAIERNGVVRRVIGFSFGEWLERLKIRDTIDLVCEIGENEWNGVREPQLSLIDIRL